MKLAIQLDDLAACSACLASGCALDEGIPGTGGWSPLDYAVVKGQESMVQLLLEYGASTLIPFKRGKNLYDGALHCASKSEKHIPILPSLLSRYLEEVNNIHEVGWTLMYAISAGGERVFKVILEHLVQNSQKISQMNQARSEDIVKQVLNHLLPHEMPGPGPQKFKKMSPLHAAVRRGHMSMAALLLEHGADVDCIDEVASTPLHCASSPEMASLLIKSGASLAPIFTETIVDLCHLWGAHFTDITKLCFANGLEDTTFQVSDLLEHPMAPSPPMPPQNYLASILALEGMGLSSPSRRCNDDAIMVLLRKDKVGQSYLLNSEFSLDDLDPFPWHLEAHCTFQELPFLRETFRQFQRRFHRVSLKKWVNLQPDRGWSPLCRAASQDLVTVMKNCMSLDAEIDFEGCPLGSALMVASACGRLEAVKFLVRSGAATSYVGRRGFIDVISVARSASVRAWLLVGRFNEQLRISMGEEAGSSPPAQIFPWSGIVQAKLRQVSIGGRMPDESTLDYAKYLVTGKEEMRGLVAANIDGLVYADDVSKSGMAGHTAVLKETHVEQRVEADTDMDTLHSGSSETSPVMLTANKNYEEPWVLDLAKGEYHQPGQLGFVVNIQS
ncbi:hypothetical protein BHE90_012644 [Fusarium euwallaceae]|uniref:Ankyrin n=1 Tax=Fusarium euwallaceae TaxID=1147111 RepID=A0A430LB47_9HYPO|nr:hypothetical protein BHE90_012644 [Fusarium euwallaceae]